MNACMHACIYFRLKPTEHKTQNTQTHTKRDRQADRQTVDRTQKLNSIGGNVE